MSIKLVLLRYIGMVKCMNYALIEIIQNESMGFQGVRITESHSCTNITSGVEGRYVVEWTNATYQYHVATFVLD